MSDSFFDIVRTVFWTELWDFLFFVVEFFFVLCHLPVHSCCPVGWYILQNFTLVHSLSAASRNTISIYLACQWKQKFFGLFVCSRLKIVLVGKELIYLHFSFFHFFFFDFTKVYFLAALLRLICFIGERCSALCTLKFCIFKPRLFVTFLKCQSYYI